MDGLPASFMVDGLVTDEDGNPMPDANVQTGGLPDTLTKSRADGTFTVEVRPAGFIRPVIVAHKLDHRARGIEIFDVPTDPVTIAIHTAELPDNPDYEYQDPGDGVDTSLEDCTHCHTSVVAQFLSSKHARSASDPLVQDLYTGINRTYQDQASCTVAGGVWKTGRAPGSDTAEDHCYLGGGVLPDLNASCGGPSQPACDEPSIPPANAATRFGACADCHAPAINGVAGGRDLQEASGLAFEKGVSCDPCHKVKDVDLTKPAGIGQRLILQRPGEPGINTFKWKPLYFGPLPDVPNVVMGGGTYQPKFKESVFCAGCHEQNQPALLTGQELDATKWPTGLPVHSTFSEWEAGPYNTPDTPCQHCHMPAIPERPNSLDLATRGNLSIVWGFERAPEDNRQHIFRSPLAGEPRLIDGALYVSINTEIVGTSLTANVSLLNNGCGHAIPTGEPMRSLVLTVRASGSCGDLDATGGFTVNDVGGARAVGVEGTDTQTSGTTITWTGADGFAGVGQVIRVVRPTGAFDDYAGVGRFGDASLTAADKGMPIRAPIAEVTITASTATNITVDSALTLQAGDILYVGDPAPASVTDGSASLNIAGLPGYTFSKVLTDATGERAVPHYRAIDMVSDNRIRPGTSARTTHQFELPAGCTDPVISAEVLYRPVPTQMARARGWTAQDYVIARASAKP